MQMLVAYNAILCNYKFMTLNVHAIFNNNQILKYLGIVCWLAGKYTYRNVYSHKSAPFCDHSVVCKC